MASSSAEPLGPDKAVAGLRHSPWIIPEFALGVAYFGEVERHRPIAFACARDAK